LIPLDKGASVSLSMAGPALILPRKWHRLEREKQQHLKWHRLEREKHQHLKWHRLEREKQQHLKWHRLEREKQQHFEHRHRRHR
jgi:hypothetical protein